MIGLYLSLIDTEQDKFIFKNLYSDMEGKMYTIAYNLLHDEYEAEDAVSEAFLHIAKRFHKLSYLQYNQFKVYCIITVKNICKNMMRSNSMVFVDIDNFDDKDFTVNDEIKHIDSIVLKEKIAELDDEEQEILTLYYFYRYSLKEISKLKNIKYDIVRKQIQKCRKQLKKLLEENGYVRY